MPRTIAVTFRRSVPNSHREVARERFGLTNGQYFAEYRFKNLWWVLNGVTIGYGDLRDEDLKRIHSALEPTDVFLGWNEHHGTQFQQLDLPVVWINHDKIRFYTGRRRGADANANA